MFIFMFFFFALFPSVFFGTGATHTTAKSVIAVLQQEVCYVQKLHDQYQEICKNEKALKELSEKCDHVGHTLSYYTGKTLSIISSKKDTNAMIAEVKKMLHEGKFILDQLDNYLN